MRVLVELPGLKPGLIQLRQQLLAFLAVSDHTLLCDQRLWYQFFPSILAF
jgi:hypothetical protein